MNKKRNVAYIKPEDPAFLKLLKKQAGYDDRNHKFDALQNCEEDFVDDDDSEQPQVVVLKEGDLTAEQAELEREKIDKQEQETKADLSKKVIFKPKEKSENNKRNNTSSTKQKNIKKRRPILSFEDGVSDEEQ